MSMTSAMLRNRHAVWALALAAALFGVLAYFTLPMQLFPDTAPPVVNVLTQYPGASAEDVAQNLSDALEEELASLEGIAEVRTTSLDGLSMISLEFQYDRSVDLAAVDAQNAISRIRHRLPTDIVEPQVLTFSTSDRPIVSLGVVADDLREARRFAEDVAAPHLRRVPGVAAVDVFGGAVDAVVVDVDPKRLSAHRVSLSTVVDSIRAHNAALPAGYLRSEKSSIGVRMEGRAADLQQLADLPIDTHDGRRLLLSELAEIRRGTLDDDATFAIDGERVIAVQVFKAADANTVDVVHAVLHEAEHLEAAHPGFSLEIGEESASFTEVSIANLLDNVWQALALATVIIFLFVGKLRSSLVLAVSMPLSFGMTFGLMRLAGVELNMVTLSAVILAVGMVVDASVVVIENISRHREAGDADAEASASTGTDEVRLPVLAGAATTVIVLVPLLFLQGFVGKTFGPLAQTLLFAFLSSVVVALVLVPVLSLYTAGGGRIDRLGERLTRPSRALMDGLRDVFTWLLRRALRHRLLTVAVALAMLGAGLAGIRARGMDVLPAMDGGSFFVSVETPSGSSLAETDQVVREIEAVLASEPEVVKIQSQVGFEPGMRSMSSALGPSQAFITVVLTDRTDRDESIWSIEERVRDGIAHVPGIRTATVRELGNTAKSTTAAPVVARISGPDPLVLDRLGDEVFARLERVPSVVEPTRAWRMDQKRYVVDVDRLRAGELGLSPAVISAHMQAGSVGLLAGEFYGDGPAIPIQVRYERDPFGDARSLLEYPIVTPELEPVPLRAVATLDEVTGSSLVSSQDFVPTLEISAFTRGRALDFVTRDVQAMLDELLIPEGYTVLLVGENADLADARGQIGRALGVALVAVYLLLVAQMRSFLHPFTILMSVPLSVSGVGIALWLAGKSVSMPVMIAFVLLVGIVVNNAIILVDFIRVARNQGVGRTDALLDALRTRFRPIMVTSISTIVGMIPLAAEWALGAERFSPLAIAVIGGMTAATFLTMIFIPVLYALLDDLVRGRATPDEPAIGDPVDTIDLSANEKVLEVS
jgi:multidrug efflux pump subunit AcrB